LADLLDHLGVPLDATLTMATRALKAAGKPRRRQVVGAGLKFRKMRSLTVPTASGTAGNRPSRELPGTVGQTNDGSQLSMLGAVPGTTGNRALSTTGTRFPSLEGTGPGTDPDDLSEGPPDEGTLSRWADEAAALEGAEQ